MTPGCASSPNWKAVRASRSTAKTLTQSGILSKLYDPDRTIRQRAAQVVTDVLHEKLPTVTFIFNTLAADKASDDRLRAYPSWISARNLSNEVSDEVVEALIQAVTSRYDIVARYYNLKRQLLGLDQLLDYDRYAPLPSASGDYHWDQAREVVLNAYHTFHPQAAEIAGQFFTHSWIDAALSPRQARRSLQRQRGPIGASLCVPELYRQRRAT